MNKIELILIAALTISITLTSCTGSAEKDRASEANMADEIQLTDEYQFSADNASLRYIAALSGVNLREEADSRSKVIQLLPYATEVTILEETSKNETIEGFSGNWLKVSANGNEGFIFGGYTIPIALPRANPTVMIDGYFKDLLVSIGFEKIHKIQYNSKTGKDERSVSSQQEIENAFNTLDLESIPVFEKEYQYAGGYRRSELSGYEYSETRGFFPGLTMQEGWLLLRIMYEDLGDEKDCKLNLRNLGFPSASKNFKIRDFCEFDIKVEKKAGQITSIKINDYNYAYVTLGIELAEGGVVLFQSFAL